VGCIDWQGEVYRKLDSGVSHASPYRPNRSTLPRDPHLTATVGTIRLPPQDHRNLVRANPEVASKGSDARGLKRQLRTQNQNPQLRL
jgi:hypothetical protein